MTGQIDGRMTEWMVGCMDRQANVWLVGMQTDRWMLYFPILFLLIDMRGFFRVLTWPAYL